MRLVLDRCIVALPGNRIASVRLDQNGCDGCVCLESAARELGSGWGKRSLIGLLIEDFDADWECRAFETRMEGDTYDILQTERLNRFGEEASGNDRKEALMILNHKDAIQYVVDNLDEIGLRPPDLFAIHVMLSDGLLADPAMQGRLRAIPVWISHSSHQSLDRAITIAEAFDILLHKAAQITNPFEQSFFLLVHIPYLQDFADVNTRTSRVAANIPRLKSDLAPIFYNDGRR